MRHVIALLVALVPLLTACTGISQSNVIGEYDPTQHSFTGVQGQDDRKRGCAPLPESFNETDLVGTWEMISGPSGEMTLTLKADGTYQQAYDFPAAGYQYKGAWHKWWFEHRGNGTSWIHFEDMRRCQDSCFSSQKKTWYDFCDETMITFGEGETVLLLTGQTGDKNKTPPEMIAPRGIILWHPQSDLDSLEPVFQIQP